MGRSDRRAYCLPDRPAEHLGRSRASAQGARALHPSWEVATRSHSRTWSSGERGTCSVPTSRASPMRSGWTYTCACSSAPSRSCANRRARSSTRIPMSPWAARPSSPRGTFPIPARSWHLYRRLSRIGRHAEVEGLRQELADRFGPLPPEVERLLDQVTLRLLGRTLGIERITVRDRSARITFRSGSRPSPLPSGAAAARPAGGRGGARGCRPFRWSCVRWARSPSPERW